MASVQAMKNHNYLRQAFNYYIVSLSINFSSWPCLHRWLETRPVRQVCPVCKAAIGKDKVIPLYGRGTTKQEDPRFVDVYRHYMILLMVKAIVSLYKKT